MSDEKSDFEKAQCKWGNSRIHFIQDEKMYMKMYNLRQLLPFLIVTVFFIQSEVSSAPAIIYPQAVKMDSELEETYKIETEYIRLYKKEDYKKALLLAKEVLDIRERKLGDDHLLIGDTVFNMAFIFAALGKVEEAESAFRRVIRIREKVLGRNHPEVVRSMEAYACFLGKIDKIKEADKVEDAIDEIIYSEDALKLPENVAKGKAIKRVLPVYTERMLQARINGTVVVRILIDESGRVMEASGRCGHELLIQAAVEAAREWRFQPLLVDEKPIKVRARIRFMFKIGPTYVFHPSV